MKKSELKCLIKEVVSTIKENNEVQGWQVQEYLQNFIRRENLVGNDEQAVKRVINLLKDPGPDMDHWPELRSRGGREDFGSDMGV